jgi:MOSC domain-containing protein YiiM
MAVVVAVSRCLRHHFSKANELSIRLVAGSGVEGDAHAGVTVQHRYSARKSGGRDQKNIRQVHLMHEELLHDLRQDRFDVWPGALGENITTRGIDLLCLPEGSLLRMGADAIVKLTGLRTPCRQMDKFAAGLSRAVFAAGVSKQSRAGVMAVVLLGGDIKPGDRIEAELPVGMARPLRHI